MAEGRRVIIIGSGLGGLECALVLCRHGYKVTVVEKHSKPGGCLQTFVRGAVRSEDGTKVGGDRFDCGFHYVGSAGKGEPLGILMDYFGLGDLPWKKLSEDCYDEICFVGEDSVCSSYPHAMGYENFVETLSEKFPESREELQRYVRIMKDVGDHTFSSFGPHAFNRLFSRSAKTFLEETVSDPKLRDILSGASLRMELSPNLPLYVYAQTAGSFIRSAWRLEGGGDSIIHPLCENIKSLGGEILLGLGVTSIDCENGKVKGVTLSDGNTLEADIVISDAHPSSTIAMVGPGGNLRKPYRSRMTSLENTIGTFTANVRLKKGTFPYLNRNVYIHKEGADFWNPDPSKTESIMVYFYPGEDGFSTHIDVMSPMDGKSLSKWKDLPRKKRGEEYEAIKQRKWEECLSLLESRFPDIRDCIEEVYTSTPLTWLSYTGTPDGSAYGVRKDSERVLETVISARTLVQGLYLTGQSLNLHGVLGVSMSAILTCGEIVGLDTLRGEILPPSSEGAR